MRAIVVGYGSIGVRHARLLDELGCDTAVVSASQTSYPKCYARLADGMEAHRPEYVVLASATHLHQDQFAELQRINYSGLTLIEKPLFHREPSGCSKPIGPVFVAYNLRFHPLLLRLRDYLEDDRVLSVHAYAGQYLPDWRPSADYRRSYSAHGDQGGGVLRDLSHEFDYLTWLLGGWTRTTALGGQWSDLDVDSDDVFCCLFETAMCNAVSLQLNYLDRVGRREIIVNTARQTLAVDFASATLRRNHELESFTVERDDTYRAMHQALIAGAPGQACTFDDGLRTVRLIEATRRASVLGEWVVNG